MPCGTRRRGRSKNRSGNCWEEPAAKSPAAFPSAFKIRPNNFLQKIETELAAGYRRIKIKVKPGWDLNVLEKIRARWADIVLSVDANSAYTLDEVEHLRKFDAFNLLMIEQPLWNDEIYLHARLQKAIQTAICLDESILQRARRRFCARDRGLPHPQYQSGPRRRIHRGQESPRCRPAPQCSGLVRRYAGVGRRAGAQHRLVDA